MEGCVAPFAYEKVLDDMEFKRYERDMSFMHAIDMSAAQVVVGWIKPHKGDEVSVVRLQCWWRRHLAQKRFLEMMWQKYDEQELLRIERDRCFVEDTARVLDR
jgi:hypothetical protein